MMRRVPEVLDCWFESGSMPYAQLHYPFENVEFFERQQPGRLHRRVHRPDARLVLHHARAFRWRCSTSPAFAERHLPRRRSRCRGRRKSCQRSSATTPDPTGDLRDGQGSDAAAVVPHEFSNDPARSRSTHRTVTAQDVRRGGAAGPEPDLEYAYRVFTHSLRQCRRLPGGVGRTDSAEPAGPLHPGQDPPDLVASDYQPA